MTSTEAIIKTIVQRYPGIQAIYLFGSWGSENEWPDSDVDIALLLPPEHAKSLELNKLIEIQAELSDLLGKSVDLLNLREVSTVFQKEVVMADRRVYTANEYAAEEFEMLTISYYQKLNEERAEVLAEGLSSGRFFNV